MVSESDVATIYKGLNGISVFFVTQFHLIMPPLTDAELLHFSKSEQVTLDNYNSGVIFARRAKKTINRIKFQVAKDRLTLAKIHLKDAVAISKCSPSMNRAVVSRAYYALYHAARAASYISLGGDDYEQHTKLPTKFPDDFPNVAYWKNTLKDARLERNRADYDPYPRGDIDFASSAVNFIAEARKFIGLTQQYIKSKSN